MLRDVIESLRRTNDKLEQVAREMTEMAEAMDAIVAESRAAQNGEERRSA